MIGPIFSQVLPVGVSEYDPDFDTQITNVALEGTAAGRTTLKLHYIARDPADDDSDFDDSDDDDEDDEDDEERELSPPKGEDRTVILCSLYPQTLEQVSLNLMLPADDSVEFIVEGPNTLHISGNLVNQIADDLPPRDDYPFSDSDFDSELDDEEGGLYDPETGLPLVGDSDDDSDEDDEMDDDEEEERFEEIKESPAKAKLNGKAPVAAPAPVDVSMDLDDDAADLSGLSKNQRKKLLKKAKAEAAAAGKSDVQAVTGKKEEKVTLDKSGKKTDEIKTAAEVTVNGADGKDVKATAKKQSKKTTLPNGVVIEDIKMGDGPQATAGKKVSLRYIGKLQNGKQFDANTKGKPFEFKLGKGEVIKGWDSGIEGMRPGGERRLTIPPSQGYGKAGAGNDIPPNAVLIFEVKLLAIKCAFPHWYGLAGR